MNARLVVNILRDQDAADRAADAMLSLENRERYLAQSAATIAGHPAPLPEREPLSMDGVRADFDRMFEVAR